MLPLGLIKLASPLQLNLPRIVAARAAQPDHVQICPCRGARNAYGRWLVECGKVQKTKVHARLQTLFVKRGLMHRLQMFRIPNFGRKLRWEELTLRLRGQQTDKS